MENRHLGTVLWLQVVIVETSDWPLGERPRGRPRFPDSTGQLEIIGIAALDQCDTFLLSVLAV